MTSSAFRDCANRGIIRSVYSPTDPHASRENGGRVRPPYNHPLVGTGSRGGCMRACKSYTYNVVNSHAPSWGTALRDPWPQRKSTTTIEPLRTERRDTES